MIEVVSEDGQYFICVILNIRLCGIEEFPKPTIWSIHRQLLSPLLSREKRNSGWPNFTKFWKLHTNKWKDTIDEFTSWNFSFVNILILFALSNLILALYFWIFNESIPYRNISIIASQPFFLPLAVSSAIIISHSAVNGSSESFKYKLVSPIIDSEKKIIQCAFLFHFVNLFTKVGIQVLGFENVL